jgi:small subunit ribosomal protein S5
LQLVLQKYASIGEAEGTTDALPLLLTLHVKLDFASNEIYSMTTTAISVSRRGRSELPSANQAPKERPEFEELVVSVDRVSRTVKGGRRMRFRALVVVGDRKGRVGTGVAKGQEVQTAVQKATLAARKSLITVPITDRGSIPHEVQARYGATTVLLLPGAVGTSVIAGGSVRAVVALAGVENVIAKTIGSNNKINTVRATMQALQQFKTARQVK